MDVRAHKFLILVKNSRFFEGKVVRTLAGVKKTPYLCTVKKTKQVPQGCGKVHN
jgi:hypothetical protein